MKKYIKSTLLAIATLGLVFSTNSCSLDVTPTETISAETYWQTDRDAWYFLNSIYRSSTPGFGGYKDAFTADVYVQYPWESPGMDYIKDGLHAGNSAASWGFGGIRKVNVFLANVDNCSMNDDLRERMKAEARFFRALEYLSKTLLHGKVPIITEVLAYDAELVPRDEVEKVRAFILDELKAAAEILPESYNGKEFYEKGRVTKYAAISYRARAALYFGDYQLAETLAKQVIDSKAHDLFTISSLNEGQLMEAEEMDMFINFEGLNIDKDQFMKGMFSYESIWHEEYSNNDNPEYIFSRQYSDINEYRDWTRYTAIRPNQMGGWSSVSPTQLLIDAYWTVEGKDHKAPSIEERKTMYEKIKADLDAYIAANKEQKKSFVDFCKEKIANGSLKDYAYLNEFKNRDSRLYASILFPFKGWHETDMGKGFYYEWVKGGNNESMTGFNFRKTVSLYDDANNTHSSSSDYPAFRFAEILLIYAEARTQNVGFDAEVQKQLNRLRARCGMPNVPTGLDKKAGLDLIRNERRIELAVEGARLDDISRYEDSYWEGIFNNVTLNKPDGEVYATMKWSSRMRLRPIPQEAIDKNPLLENDQNPGY